MARLLARAAEPEAVQGRLAQTHWIVGLVVTLAALQTSNLFTLLRVRQQPSAGMAICNLRTVILDF